MQAGKRWTATVGAALLCLALSPAAFADSLAYLKDSNVWIANVDGTNAYQVTLDGTAADPYRSVSQDDSGILVAARGKRIYRLRQNGDVLATLQVAAYNNGNTDPNAITAPLPDEDVSPPNDVDVTPDGTKVAYWFLSTCFSSSFGGQQPCSRFGVSYTTRFTTPAETDTGDSHGSYPEWVGNVRLVGASGTQLAVNEAPETPDCPAGQPHCDRSFWLTNCYTPPSSAQVCEAPRAHAVSRDGTRLAVVSTETGTGAAYRLVLYTSAGLPARGAPDPASGGVSEPDAQCMFFGATGGEFGDPDFSPDGTGLAWHEGDGIHVIRGGDVATLCAQSSPAATIPGATDPSWGPADVNPGPRSGSNPATNEPTTTPPGGGADPTTTSTAQQGTAPDAADPVVTGFAVRGASFPRGRGALTLVFDLSEPGTLRFAVQRAFSGRRKGEACVRRRRTGKRCKGWAPVGSFTRPAVAGANTVRFAGRLARRLLPKGSYRIVMVARDAAGNAAAPVRRTFRVL